MRISNWTYATCILKKKATSLHDSIQQLISYSEPVLSLLILSSGNSETQVLMQPALKMKMSLTFSLQNGTGKKCPIVLCLRY